MPEWLMGLPAKQLDYVLVGSNPTVVDLIRFAVAQLVERQTVEYYYTDVVICWSLVQFRFARHLYRLWCNG